MSIILTHPLPVTPNADIYSQEKSFDSAVPVVPTPCPLPDLFRKATQSLLGVKTAVNMATLGGGYDGHVRLDARSAHRHPCSF